MQTFTHLPIGTLIGALAFPDQPLAQIACVVAAVGPDIVMVPTFALDKLRGKQPLANQSRFVIVAKELSHSLLLAIACVVLGLLLDQSLITAFGIGWVSHVAVDILTHGDPYFQSYGDPHYTWPFGSLRRWGIWDYRIRVGQLWPLKPIELYILITCSAVTLLVWLVH